MQKVNQATQTHVNALPTIGEDESSESLVISQAIEIISEMGHVNPNRLSRSYSFKQMAICIKELEQLKEKIAMLQGDVNGNR